MRHPIFTAEHEQLRSTVRRFVDTEVRPHVDEWEAAGNFPDDLFRRCGELGFLGLHFPTRWGGSDGDLATGLVFVE
jgi:citronellyl-CoA dehydrogenase